MRNERYYLIHVAVVISLLFALSGCAVPLGLYGDDPSALWNAPCSQISESDKIPNNYRGAPIVIKRFDAAYDAPVGANYIVGNSKDPARCGENTEGVPRDSMSQAYSQTTDLAQPIFESTYRYLRQSGFPVWKDYFPAIETTTGPPNASEFFVLTGRVVNLEMDTFSDSDIQDGVSVTLDLEAYDQNMRIITQWSTTIIVKTLRAENDILEVVGQKLAMELAQKVFI